MSERRRAALPWGDGFVDDDWSAMVAVTDWARLHPDEYVRLFPRLVGTPVPDCIGDALASVVAARSWRLHRLTGGSSSVALLSMSADEAHERGRTGHADVVVTPGRLGSALAFLRGNVTDRDERASENIVQDQAALLFLDDILRQLRCRALEAADGAVTARFAFLAGIHPAYLWPVATASSGRDTAAGWLGIVGRGRPALMPHEVSAYFLDAIECRKGCPVALRDPAMAEFLTASANLDDVWTAACLRREGMAAIVRRTRAAPAGRWSSVAPSGPTWTVKTWATRTWATRSWATRSWATRTWSQSDRPL